MVKPTQDQIFERLETLPDEIFDLIFSPKSSQINKKIFEKNHLPEDKREIALELMGLILMGFLHPEDFVDEFQKESLLPLEYCKSFFNDINNQIFEPVKDILKKIYTAPIYQPQKISTLQEETLEKEIPKSSQPIYQESPVNPPPKPIDLLKSQIPQVIDLKEKEFKSTEPKPVFEIKPPQPLSKEKISMPPTPPTPLSTQSSQHTSFIPKTTPEKQPLSFQPPTSPSSTPTQRPPVPQPPPPQPVFIHKEEKIEPIKKTIDLSIPEPPKISEIKKTPPPPPKIEIEIGNQKPKIKTVNFFNKKSESSTSLQSPKVPPSPSLPPSPPLPPQQ